MKNLHIIPTDKPSRLFKVSDELKLTRKFDFYNGAIYQNIYITSDEKIKVGDWVIEFQKGDNIGEVHFINGEYVIANDIQKKIIITTDQDLIKDGVQAIDDEFLKWFVNNPSCEEVEIKEKQHFQTDKSKRKNPLNGVYYSYKIIIPKEESKQESVFENAKSSLKKYLFDNKEKVAKDLEQMRGWSNTDKQETLEPVKDLAYWKKNAEEDYLKIPISVLRYITELEERMYSKKDMEDSFVACWKANVPEGIECKLSFKEWFEQFKKK